MNYDVVNVGRCLDSVGLEDNVHQPPEHCWSPVETERKNPVLPAGSAEDCLLAGYGTCQYPLGRSRVEIKRAFPSRLINSSTRGRGQLSNTETASRFVNVTQFQTAVGLWDDLAGPLLDDPVACSLLPPR